MTSKEKSAQIAQFLNETIETFEEEYTFEEFRNGVGLLLKHHAEKFKMHFGPNLGDE